MMLLGLQAEEPVDCHKLPQTNTHFEFAYLLKICS